MIYKEIDVYDFIKEFKDFGRDNQYTEEALEALYEYYDNIGDDVEMDVIAIICDWAEYDAKEAFSEFVEGEIDDDELENFVSEHGEYNLKEIADFVERDYTVICLSDSILVQV